jgi:hypothetical protein
MVPVADGRIFDPGDPVDPDTDDGVRAVVAWLRRGAGGDPQAFFAALVRQAIDEVVDGPRTARWDLEQLESTEKTYVGTKIEIIVRAALELERGSIMDLEILGHPVDVKWSKTSMWQIPEEAIGHICLCLGGLRGLTQFQVGVIRCDAEVLNLGRNKDQKTTISAAHKQAHMVMLVPPAELPANFVATIPAAARDRIFEGRTIQERVTALFQELPGRPIPRDAIRTIARTEGDSMRRLRADAYAEDSLGALRILSFKYGNGVVQALGHPALLPGEFMGVPQRDLDRIPESKRRLLTSTARARYRL